MEEERSNLLLMGKEKTYQSFTQKPLVLAVQKCPISSKLEQNLTKIGPKQRKSMFSKEIEIVIILLQNVSNGGVSGGDGDGSVGGCGSWGCVVRCRGGHGACGDDVGDGVVVVSREERRELQHTVGGGSKNIGTSGGVAVGHR